MNSIMYVPQRNKHGKCIDMTKGQKDGRTTKRRKLKRQKDTTFQLYCHKTARHPPLLQASLHLIYVVIILKIKIEQESKLCFGVGNCYEIQQIGSTLTGMSSKRWESWLSNLEEFVE